MELKRVVVTGIGAISPLGNTAAETWENVKSGKNMAQRWLGTTLLQSEKQFRAVKGALSISRSA